MIIFIIVMIIRPEKRIHKARMRMRERKQRIIRKEKKGENENELM